jgi:ankyrin repeat protein
MAAVNGEAWYIVELLLARQVNVEAKNLQGKKAFDIATTNGNQNVFGNLLKKHTPKTKSGWM